MKRLILVGLLAAVVLMAVGTLAAFRPDPAKPEAATPPLAKNEAPASEPHSDDATQGAENGRANSAPQPRPSHHAEADMGNDVMPAAEATVSQAEGAPGFSSLLQKPMQQVAKAYEAQSRYPTFSQPIANSAELLRYKPHQPQTVSLPFPTPDGGTYEATLGLDRYRYLKGDVQQLTLRLSSSTGLLISQVKALVTTLNGDVLYELPLQLGSGSTLKHSQTVDLAQAWNHWPIELQWKVTAQVGEQRLAVAAPFRYEAPVAVLEQPHETRVEGEFLTIPLRIETEHPGYFFVQANLYSLAGHPLAHLQTEGPITPEHPPLHLKVSGALLTHLEQPGPYLLQDIQLERLGDEHLQDRYGKSRETAYRIKGYPLTDYAESTWTDSLAQQRLEFLQGLGQ